jgi:hypothetical protein
MVTFTAWADGHNDGLYELTKLGDFKRLDPPPITDLSTFSVTKNNWTFEFTGSHMTAVGDLPTAGTVNGIAVSLGRLMYTIDNLSLPFAEIEKFFDEDFRAASLFRGDDLLNGSEHADVLEGFKGDDIVIGAGGNDHLDGERGDDKLKGGPGDDILKGGPGDDTLHGGEGTDVLSGGEGVDIFIFNKKLDYRGHDFDTLVDFQSGKDKFHLTAEVFKGISEDIFWHQGEEKVGKIVYHKRVGELVYYMEFKDNVRSVHFATMTEHPDLDKGDFVIV